MPASRRFAALLALLTFGATLAGCLGGETGDPTDPDADIEALVPVQERYLQPYIVDGTWSSTLVAGAFGILDGIRVDIPLTLDPTEGVPAASGDASTNLGLFLPDIPGCDWTATELPDMCKVPVVADAGPYYSASTGISEIQTEGDNISTEPAGRLGKYLIDNLVPHGYAVAQIAVLGTGDSGHCMDLMGSAEQAGIVAAVEWLGSQPWSNGAVGLIGRSYDGSTPWEAAMHNPAALKTIVPISGLIGQHDLMWRNGSAEFRGPGVLYGLYAAMTIDGEAEDAQQVLCPDYILGAPEGVAAWVTGDRVAEDVNDYWAERRFLDDTLANWKGSVYFIHGMQDWNVDNHMAFPTYQMLIDNGFEVKGLFGQWAHNYPDRLSEHENCGRCQAPESVRYDWAQDLLEWFDHYLKGTGPKPQLHAEIQDNAGAWRIEPTYPPQDVSWLSIPLSETTKLHTTPDIVAGAPFLGIGPGTSLQYELPAFDNDTRIAGNARFHVTVTPAGPGGQVFALLRDADGKHYGHAIMDLRYAAGGDAMHPVIPGMPLVAKMEFFALDAVIPAGTAMVLELAVTGEDYLPPSVNDPVVIDAGSASVLKLPIQEPTADRFFTPPRAAE